MEERNEYMWYVKGRNKGEQAQNFFFNWEHYKVSTNLAWLS